jgi:hypothetical protein
VQVNKPYVEAPNSSLKGGKGGKDGKSKGNQSSKESERAKGEKEAKDDAQVNKLHVEVVNEPATLSVFAKRKPAQRPYQYLKGC